MQKWCKYLLQCFFLRNILMRTPFVSAFRTDHFVGAMTEHDALKNGSEWSYSNPSADQDRVFSAEDVAGRSSVGTVNINLQEEISLNTQSKQSYIYGTKIKFKTTEILFTTKNNFGHLSIRRLPLFNRLIGTVHEKSVAQWQYLVLCRKKS